ncbi:hypothetical protein GOBAR_DD00854 [Gossypium barbadense]|nr:hypothetical protein GOBAR_DD00854 [Gossypium barbadense]
MNRTLLTVDFAMRANNSDSTSGIERATKEVRTRPEDESDYNKVLVGGSWVIFGRYLTVRLWSPEFSTSQSGIESQVVWIRLHGLPEGYYLDCLLRVIGQTVGPVVKLDVQTDCRVEYEVLPNICFQCGMYEHVVDVCPEITMASPVEELGCT